MNQYRAQRGTAAGRRASRGAASGEASGEMIEIEKSKSR
jgi:hypothetical protein